MTIDMKQFFEKYFGRIEWLIITLFLVGLPLVFSNKLLDAVLYSRYLYLSVLLIVLSIIVSFRLFKNGFQFFFTKSDKLIFGAGLLFVLVNLLASFGVINANEAIFHTLREGALMLLFFLFYQLLRNTPQAKDVVIKAVVVMTFVFIVIGLVQVSKADFTPFKNATNFYAYYFRQSIAEVKSTLASINPFASFLVISLPFSLYSLLAYNKYWKIFSGIVAFLSMGFIVMLASKASMGSLGLAFIVLVLCLYIYLFLIRPKETGKRFPLYTAVLILVLPFVIGVAGIFLVKKTDIKVAKIIVERVQQVLSPELCMENIYNTDNPTSTQTRTLVWANTIQMARENPILGVGPGQWRIEYAKYGLDGFEYAIRNGAKHFERPHNDFLWILGETGFTGLILYLFVYVGILGIAFRLFYKAKNINTRILAALIFSFLIGFLINLFVSFPRESITHNVVYLLLFALVLNEVSGNVEQKTRTLKPQFKIGIILILLAFTGANVWAANQIFQGEHAARAVKVGIARKNYQMVIRAVNSVKNTLYTMDPFSSPMDYYEGVAWYSLKNIESANLAFQEAYKINPYNIRVLNDLGTSYDLTGNRKEALKYYVQALEISPRYNEALINTAIVYYNLNDFDKSLETILKIAIKDKKQLPKFQKTMLTIMRKNAIIISNQCDIAKLKAWVNNENKIEATFVTIQNTKQPFNKVLLQEVGK